MTDEGERTAMTMWSESLIDGLYISIAKSGNDNALRDLIKELREKGYEDAYLINKVSANVSPAAGERLQALIGGGAKPSASRSRGAAKKKKKKGFFSKMFGK